MVAHNTRNRSKTIHSQEIKTRPTLQHVIGTKTIKQIQHCPDLIAGNAKLRNKSGYGKFNETIKRIQHCPHLNAGNAKLKKKCVYDSLSEEIQQIQQCQVAAIAHVPTSRNRPGH